MRTNTCSDFIHQATEYLREAFGANLLSVVQLGSLAHGGFSNRFSDIDIAVILQHSVPDTFIEDIKQQISILEPLELSQRVSLFWTIPDFSWGRMRPVDQVDLCDNGQVLWGNPIRDFPRPDVETVCEDMRINSLPYWSDKIYHFAEHLPASDREFKEYVRCLLYPARLIFTWQTGKLSSNDEAVQYFDQIVPSTFNREMVRDGLRCRNAEIKDKQLFCYQTSLITQRAATLDFLRLTTENYLLTSETTS
jgi:predicted nucleotidyltransferase